MNKFRKIIVAVTPGGSRVLSQRLVALRWPGSLLLLFIAAVLGSAASTAAAQCPAGSPTPYGLIGDTWLRPDVQSAIGCPREAEHDVPGRRGRLQTFANGQIAWTPDQGPKMTIWVIRNKGRFHVQWDSNDPGWSYDKYLIRWDRDGKNLGQSDISGTRGGSSNFDFTDPGSYAFVVEGRSGGGYHHGWTIPVGGVVQPGDFFQHTAPTIAARCPAGTPVPYGLIGNTWFPDIVSMAIGCPKEPEHDVPGRRGRLQTFTNGQIAWTPDQGPKMTIWAIRNKAHFRVQWDTNDPTWSYDKYLIRWDRDGKNMGQRDISGTRNGWWDFDFTDPGTYTFIVEGRSGGGYHHGWTISRRRGGAAK